MNWFTTGPGLAKDHWKTTGELGFDGSDGPPWIDLKNLKYGCRGILDLGHDFVVRRSGPRRGEDIHRQARGQLRQADHRGRSDRVEPLQLGGVLVDCQWPTIQIVFGDGTQRVGIVETTNLQELPGGRVDDDGGLAIPGTRGEAFAALAVLGRSRSQSSDTRQFGDRLVQGGIELCGGSECRSNQKHRGALEPTVGRRLVGQHMIQSRDPRGSRLELLGQDRWISGKRRHIDQLPGSRDGIRWRARRCPPVDTGWPSKGSV